MKFEGLTPFHHFTTLRCSRCFTSFGLLIWEVMPRDGDVYTDQAYHCGLSSGCFNAGSGADVAERIDTSEPVEPGDVVEIDSENPGLYRKAQMPYSIRMIGVSPLLQQSL